MALSDLRRLAATPVTPAPQRTGYTDNLDETGRNPPFPEAVTSVTPVTRQLGNASAYEWAIPPNDLAPPPASEPMPTLADAEWLDQMAEALMANPVNRITDREKALGYYRCRARAMFDATPDPYARGLLLGYERHRHALRGHSNATGR